MINSRASALFRGAAGALSVALCAAVWPCYAFRPDTAVAVTVFPVWAWLLPGGFLAALSAERGRRKRCWPLAALWLLFLLATSDEPLALLRWGTGPAAKWQEARAQGDALRIVTLNCATRIDAARETFALEPDIVLLQESPPRGQLEALVRDELAVGWTLLWGIDSSLLVRGEIEPVPLPRALAGYFVCGRATLASGARLNVISLRLRPALVRLDLWSPDCWRAQTENRRQRRRELQQVVALMASEGDAVPWIVGGDFNAPAGDAVFDLLQPGPCTTASTAPAAGGATPSPAATPLPASTRFGSIRNSRPPTSTPTARNNPTTRWPSANACR